MKNHLKPEETSFKKKNKEEEKEYEEEYENEKEKEYEKEGVKEKGANALTTLSSLFSQYSFSTALRESVEDWGQYTHWPSGRHLCFEGAYHPYSPGCILWP